MKSVHTAQSQSGVPYWTSVIVLIALCSVVFAPATPAQHTASYNQTALTLLSKIAAAGASGQFETARQLFREGKEAGLSELQMYEAVLNLLPYIGYPQTLSTLGSFQHVYPEYIAQRSPGESLQPTEPWQDYATTVWGEHGTQIQQQLSGGRAESQELSQQLTQVNPELAEWVWYDNFGRVFGRAGLSLLECEAIVLGVLIALGAPQISFHYRALLRVGGDDALVEAVLEAVSGIVDDKARAAARGYMTRLERGSQYGKLSRQEPLRRLMVG